MNRAMLASRGASPVPGERLLPMRISSLKLTIGLALALGMLFGATNAEAGEGKLLGTWQLERIIAKGKEKRPPPALQIRMTFKKNHTWVGTMTMGQKTKTQGGTWTLKGKTLTTVVKGKSKTETMTVGFVGGHLELTKPKDQGKAVFKRVK
jgi:hypothetical protein